MKNLNDLEKLISAKKSNPVFLPFDEKSADLGKIDLRKKR